MCTHYRSQDNPPRHRPPLTTHRQPPPGALHPPPPAPQVNDLAWTWACFVDLAAGLVFATELFLGFSVSFMASNRGEQREVCGGRAVARYYLRYGSFWQDALSTAIWVTQV